MLLYKTRSSKKSGPCLGSLVLIDMGWNTFVFVLFIANLCVSHNIHPICNTMSWFSMTSNGSSLRKKPIYCDCGSVTSLKTSWIDENRRGRFFGYALYEVILWLHIIWVGIIICWFCIISFSVILDLFTLSFSIFQVWGTKECNFFDRVDDEMTPRAKEVILSFMRKVTNLKNIVARWSKEEWEKNEHEDENDVGI